jgi:hypothetical protein
MANSITTESFEQQIDNTNNTITTNASALDLISIAANATDDNPADKTNDSSVSPITAIDMCDKFLHLYNAKHKVGGTLCENVNVKDPLSTNQKLETFNEYIVEHKYLLGLGRHYTDVYDSNSQLHNDINFNMYALISYGKIKYLSLSYISLLLTGVKENDLSKNWNIVTL